jgi:hypothetical protein
MVEQLNTPNPCKSERGCCAIREQPGATRHEQACVGFLFRCYSDPGSAATFAAIRAELPEKAEFATIQLQGAAIRQQMRQLREKYSEIVIDVGGRDTGSLRAALTVSDTILFPFQPRSVDLWAGTQIAALVAEAREVNDGLRACSFLNMADAQGHDNEEALEGHCHGNLFLLIITHPPAKAATSDSNRLALRSSRRERPLLARCDNATGCPAVQPNGQ